MTVQPLYRDTSLSLPRRLAQQALQRMVPVRHEATPSDVGFSPHGGNRTLFSTTDPEVLLDGPAGTGKTLSALWYMHLLAHNHPGFRGLLLRKTHVSLTSTALVTFRNHVLNRESFGAQFFGGSGEQPAGYRYPNGSVILVGGLDNPTKILSSEYDVVFVNEASEVTEEDWEMIIGRLRNFQLPYQQVIGDTNPQYPNHWLNQRAQKHITSRILTTHKDNPRYWDMEAGEWTPEGEQYVLGKLTRLTGVRYQRYYLGKWVAAEGQVYEQFDTNLHLLTPQNPRYQLALDRIKFGWTIGGIDWGWSNPGVMQVWAVDDDFRLYLICEYYMTHRSVEGWWVPKALELQQMYGVRLWVADPSEPQNIRSMQNAGLNTVKAINDILPGISAVQERLRPSDGGDPRLYLFDEALQDADQEMMDEKRPWSTAQEFPELVWAKGAHGEIKRDRPLDVNNHGLDTLRYVVAEMDLRGLTRGIHPAIAGAWTDLPGVLR